MKKLLPFTVTTLALFTFLSSNLKAAPKIDLNAIAKCTTIEDKAKRLLCFDTATLSLKEIDKATVKALPPVKIEKISDSKTTKKDDSALISSEEAFGRTEAEINAIQTLKSNIVGDFRGWKKGAVLTLANGQKWKVMSRSGGYVKLTDPKIEIKRAILGSFKMKVEGLNSSAKVKRIK